MKFAIACLIGVAASVHVAEDDFNYDDPCADIEDLGVQFECYEREICGEEGCPEDPCEDSGESCYEDLIDDLADGEPCDLHDDSCWDDVFNGDISDSDDDWHDPCYDIEDPWDQLDCYEYEICGEQGCPYDPCEDQGESCYFDLVSDLMNEEPCFVNDHECWVEVFGEDFEDHFDYGPCDNDDEQCWIEHWIGAPCELDDGDCWMGFYSQLPCDW